MKAPNAAASKLKSWLKQRLSAEQRASLRRVQANLRALAVDSENLPSLARIYGTDKWGGHWYASHYIRHFKHLRDKSITLLEIGVGGYDNPVAGGGSLRMWRDFFPRGKIVGLDLHEKSFHAERRIVVYRGDQSDPALLRRIVTEQGAPDIVIDDGSHVNSHVLSSFEVLFPLLAGDGLYVVEDTQTSYWPSYGGSSDDLLGARTSMTMLKSLADSINHREFQRPDYCPNYYDQHVVGLHFYHNLAIVEKGPDSERASAKGCATNGGR